MTHAFLQASLQGDIATAETLTGVAIPADWPDNRYVLELRLSQLERDPTLQHWLLRAMSLRESGQMIGHIGFHDAPGAPHLEQWCPGGLEMGFTVFGPHRRRGFALEAAHALMRWARESHGVNDFLVTISPQNSASMALAARLGFLRVGSHVDEIDGVEDILVRRAPRSAG
jgi:RimJ/RimL family protein N-acetyltransferase